MRTEDGCIIQDCLNGKPEAFGMLVDKYKEGVYAFVYAQLRGFQDAQDVTQEVFLQAYRDLRSLRRWESFCFWIYRIAHRCCAQCFRTRSKRVDREFIDDQAPNLIDASSLESYRADKLDESVREALDSLPEAYREVLLLHYFGGMTSRDIAEALGISPTAVLKRLSRAQGQLKKEMIAMMGTAFHEQRLRTGFTFRIVESVKRIKINPMPRMAGLPWGLSLAAGIIIAVLSLNPQMSITNDMAIPTGSPLPVETEVLKTGEIPVYILRTSEISVISSKQGNGDGGKPHLQEPQNAFMLAPHAEGGRWAKKADMPKPNTCFSASAVNGKIYAIGGSHDGRNRFSTVWEYDPVSDKWTGKKNMSMARTALSTSVVYGKIYAIGGVNNNNVALQALEEYDPNGDVWRKRADMPTARGNFRTCVVDGKIYAIGGWVSKNAFTSVVEEYDPKTDKWTKKANMPEAKYELGIAAANGKIYAIGGAQPPKEPSASVDEYDPAADKWTRKTDMPTARAGLSTSVVDGKIYAIGGLYEAGIATVEEYDPVADTWRKMADMPTARYMLCTSALGGKIYAFGGWGEEGNVVLSTVEEYIPEVRESTAVSPQGKLPKKWGEVKSDIIIGETENQKTVY